MAIAARHSAARHADDCPTETCPADIYGDPIDVDHPMTADEFMALGDRLPYRAELIDGEVVVNSPGLRHQDVVLRLAVRLRSWTEAGAGRGYGGFDVDTRLDDRNVYRPDVWWFSESRKPSLDETYPSVVPDLAVEVLSPGTRHKDLGVKRDNYERNGVAELWIIDPLVSATRWRRSAADVPTYDETVEVERGGVLESPQLPGFAVRLDDLFR